MKQYMAGRAFITYNNKVLIIRESTAYRPTANKMGGTNIGKYDLVGGKIDPGEGFNEGLSREVFEETGLKITIGKPFFVTEWYPEIKAEKVQIIGIFAEATSDSDQVKLSTDHDDFKWIDLSEYKNYKLIDATEKAFKTVLNINGK